MFAPTLTRLHASTSCFRQAQPMTKLESSQVNHARLDSFQGCGQGTFRSRCSRSMWWICSSPRSIPVARARICVNTHQCCSIHSGPTYRVPATARTFQRCTWRKAYAGTHVLTIPQPNLQAEISKKANAYKNASRKNHPSKEECWQPRVEEETSYSCMHESAQAAVSEGLKLQLHARICTSSSVRGPQVTAACTNLHKQQCPRASAATSWQH
jgi:hypothetical protein